MFNTLKKVVALPERVGKESLREAAHRAGLVMCSCGCSKQSTRFPRMTAKGSRMVLLNVLVAGEDFYHKHFENCGLPENQVTVWNGDKQVLAIEVPAKKAA